jgi:hypothetical protein
LKVTKLYTANESDESQLHLTNHFFDAVFFVVAFFAVPDATSFFDFFVELKQKEIKKGIMDH